MGEKKGAIGCTVCLGRVSWDQRVSDVGEMLVVHFEYTWNIARATEEACMRYPTPATKFYIRLAPVPSSTLRRCSFSSRSLFVGGPGPAQVNLAILKSAISFCGFLRTCACHFPPIKTPSRIRGGRLFRCRVRKFLISPSACSR